MTLFFFFKFFDTLPQKVNVIAIGNNAVIQGSALDNKNGCSLQFDRNKFPNNYKNKFILTESFPFMYREYKEADIEHAFQEIWKTKEWSSVLQENSLHVLLIDPSDLFANVVGRILQKEIHAKKGVSIPVLLNPVLDEVKLTSNTTEHLIKNSSVENASYVLCDNPSTDDLDNLISSIEENIKTQPINNQTSMEAEIISSIEKMNVYSVKTSSNK
jgi:hypothetical protein